ISSGQADDETAKTAAIDACQKRADALPAQRKCEIYAIGDNVVYARGRPPMPPTPWVAQDSAIESPLVPANIPMMREAGKTSVERNYLPAKAPKALALGPQGGFFFYTNQQSIDEAVRRALELCGGNAGVPCLVVAVDNNFVVPIPSLMKATGYFRPGA